jgi:hypothetical protein
MCLTIFFKNGMHPKITKCLGTDEIAQVGNVMMYFQCSKVIGLCSFMLEHAITVLHMKMTGKMSSF